MQWSELIEHPSVILILGFRRMGKTALGYWLVDTLADCYKLNKVVFGVPEGIRRLLPKDFVLVQEIEEIPENSIVLVDEVSMFAYARRAMSRRNELFDHLTAMSGKRRQTIIYITHHSRKVDINLVTDVDAIIYKRPSRLQIRLDRPEVREFARKAYQALKNKGKEYSYVFSFMKDLEILMKNPLPYFWSEELSELILKETYNDNGEIIDDIGFDYTPLKDEDPDTLFEMFVSLPKNSRKRRKIFEIYLKKIFSKTGDRNVSTRVH